MHLLVVDDGRTIHSHSPIPFTFTDHTEHNQPWCVRPSSPPPCCSRCCLAPRPSSRRLRAPLGTCVGWTDGWMIQSPVKDGWINRQPHLLQPNPISNPTYTALRQPSCRPPPPPALVRPCLASESFGWAGGFRQLQVSNPHTPFLHSTQPSPCRSTRGYSPSFTMAPPFPAAPWTYVHAMRGVRCACVDDDGYLRAYDVRSIHIYTVIPTRQPNESPNHQPFLCHHQPNKSIPHQPKCPQREVGAVLEEYSLALEVGPSQVVQGERGLFVRLIGEDVQVRSVHLTVSCVCIYINMKI